MSRKTSIPRKTIEGRRGIQTYRSCDKGFADSMRLTTFKETDDAVVVRHSEFAKPYGEQYEDPWEDFSAMEYQAPNLPPWGFDYPGMGDPAAQPWKVVFFCDGTFDVCFCNEASMVFPLNCSWEIIGVGFDPPWNEVGVSFDKTHVYTYGLATATGCGYLTVTMRAVFKVGDKTETVIGTHSGIKVCACKEEDCEGCNDSAIAWDASTSAHTIARNNSVTVAITDSLGIGGPYSWSVSGTGFTLDNAITVGLSNTLNASGSACGMAEITVIGCGGTEIKGYVRCTTGQWVLDTASFCLNCSGYCTTPPACTPGAFTENDPVDPRWRYDGCGSCCGTQYCSEGSGGCTGSCYNLIATLKAACEYCDALDGGGLYGTFSRVDRYIWSC